MIHALDQRHRRTLANEVDSIMAVLREEVPGQERVLTPDAQEFVRRLVGRFGAERDALLARRVARQRAFRAGELPDFLHETAAVRAADWSVAPAPPDLDDRRVEITGPTDAKMMINALNSGASVFMADFEDALSPPWANVVGGQVNCLEAIRGTLRFRSPEGKDYQLDSRTATLVVRPRGWHLEEAHFLVDGRPAPASLFDFGLYFFHNAHELLARGSGPYFYLPKLESHLEARLWNQVFDEAQDILGIPRGTIRATVLIETIVAAFEMDEILYELRPHAAGLNAGRWDYIFSIIKKLGHRSEFILPDRAQVTMTVPFMEAYTELLVQTCHRRRAHAIGGMAAFIPSRRDPAVNRVALERVREDKGREASRGFDGAWVAHPDLVGTVREVFDKAMGDKPHQKDRRREEGWVERERLLDVRILSGRITEAGVRGNTSVALQYLEAWLRGHGAVAINNMMEDTATAEIARAQLWQWIHHAVTTDGGKPVTLDGVRKILGEELGKLRAEAPGGSRLEEAAHLLDRLIAAEEFPEFLTLEAYQKL